GASSEFNIIDVEKYALVDWTLCFYYVAGQDDAGNNILKKFASKDIKKSDENPNATYNAETGNFIYTYTNDFDHELAEFRLLYSYKFANSTRVGDDNDGVATGMLRSVVADVIISLDDTTKEVEINAKGTDEEKTATINYTVKTGEKLTLYGEFTLPPWSYKEGKCTADPWTAVIKVDGTAVAADAVVPSSDGSPATIQFTAANPIVKLEEAPTAPKDIVVSVELTGNEYCKSGDVVFAPKYVSYDEQEKTADTLTASVKVKGIANLDIDGNGTFNTYDVRLVFNYATVGRNNTSLMTKGIPASLKLAGREAELKATIEAMIE
ncbi:MAG: hypothetical protein IJS15_10765, partial [Victivallales bacterium]|nr:hypothetical protein [Victivallales bacterium]